MAGIRCADVQPVKLTTTGRVPFRQVVKDFFAETFLTENQKRVNWHLANAHIKEKQATSCSRAGLYYRAGTILMDAYREIDGALKLVAKDTHKYDQLERYRETLIAQAVGYFGNEIMEGGRTGAEIYTRMAECCTASAYSGNKAYAKDYMEQATSLEKSERDDLSSARRIALCRLERELREHKYDGNDDALKATLQRIVAAISNLQQEDLGEKPGWLKIKIYRLFNGPYGITRKMVEILRDTEERLGIVNVPVPD